MRREEGGDSEKGGRWEGDSEKGGRWEEGEIVRREGGGRRER